MSLDVRNGPDFVSSTMQGQTNTMAAVSSRLYTAVHEAQVSWRNLLANNSSVGIRQQAIISALFILLPCILAANISFMELARVAQKEITAQVEAEAIDLKHLITREFEHMLNLGMYLSRTEPLLRDTPDQQRSVFTAALGADASQGLHIILSDTTGQQLFNSRAPLGAVLPRLADQASLDRVMSERRAVFSHVARGNVSSRSLYTVLVPVLNNGAVERVFVVNRTTDHLLALINQQLPNASWQVSLHDRYGRRVVTTASNGVAELAPASGLTEIPQTVVGEDGKTITSSLRVPASDWTVAVTVNAFDAAKSRWSVLLFLQVAAVILSLAIAWWMARRIIRPIAALERLANDLGSYQKSSLPVLEITEIRNAAETLVRTGTVLQQSRERLATIIASASDAIICIDRNGRITLFNDEAVVIFRCPAVAALGQPVKDFLTLTIDHDGSGRHGASVEECLGRRSGGDEFAAEVSIARPVDDDEFHYSLIVRDITMRQRVASENARLAVVVASSADAIVSLGLDHTVLSWNASAERLFGYSATEIVGHSYVIVIPDEIKEQYMRNCDKICSGEAIALVTTRRRKNGSLFPAEVSAAPLRNAAGTVVGMSTVLRDITERVHATNLQNRLAAIVEASVDPIVGYAPDGTVMTWNGAAKTLFGYAPEEIIGKSLKILLPPGENNTVAAKLDAASQGSISNLHVERVRKDGTLVSVALTAAPIKDAGGNIAGFSVVYRDITESKRHEQQMRMVMRELSHRAKNLLAVVSAMARSATTSSTSIGSFVDDFCFRLHGLSLSHDLLVRKEWTGASMHALAEAQMRGFVSKGAGQLHLDGVEIALTPAAAQMIGLALHELATNAAKHGAFSTGTGVVRLTWGIDYGDADGPQLHMTWRESDGPTVIEPDRQGLGRDVLEEMLSESLDGTATLEFAPTGVVWRFRAPLSAVEASVSTGAKAVANRSSLAA